MDFLNTPEKLNRRLTHLPMGRFGEAVEQAKAVLFRKLTASRNDDHTFPYSRRSHAYPVASDDSSYITGSDFMVDGGLSACYVVSGSVPDRGLDGKNLTVENARKQTPEGQPLLPAPSSMTVSQ
jgi:hypothetical protein